MARRYGRRTTRIPARRTRVTFRARTPAGARRKVSFLVRRRRKWS